VVTPELVKVLENMLTSGAKVYCCSDVKPLSAEMQAVFLMNPSFELDEGAYVEHGEMEAGTGGYCGAASSTA
jgi:tRNA G46 methylase TrmB